MDSILEMIKDANSAYQLCQFEKAFRFYEKVNQTVPNGHVSYRLGIMYDKGYYIPVDKKKASALFARASELLEKESEEGDSDAQCDLGYMYANSCGKRKNYTLSVQYYQKAAAQGNARAQCNLGYMYDAGKGVITNKETAARYYKLSADQGYAVAQCNLGYMYQYGHGVPVDLSKTVYYYLQATLMHNVRAERYMKSIMLGGEGLEIRQLGFKEWSRLSREKAEQWPASHATLHPKCQSNIVDVYILLRLMLHVQSLSSSSTSVSELESESSALMESEPVSPLPPQPSTSAVAGVWLPSELIDLVVQFVILLWEYQIDPPYSFLLVSATPTTTTTT